MDATGPPMWFPKSSPDPKVAPYPFELPVFIIWIIVATAIAELELDAALHQCRATHAHSGASRIHSPFFSEYRRNSHIRHLRDFGSWRFISDAPTSILGQVLVHEIQCVLVIRESFTKEYGSRVFHSSSCGPLFLHIEPNQLSLITRTHCIPLV